jgi:hypothetical protein
MYVCISGREKEAAGATIPMNNQASALVVILVVIVELLRGTVLVSAHTTYILALHLFSFQSHIPSSSHPLILPIHSSQTNKGVSV